MDRFCVGGSALMLLYTWIAIVVGSSASAEPRTSYTSAAQEESFVVVDTIDFTNHSTCHDKSGLDDLIQLGPSGEITSLQQCVNLATSFYNKSYQTAPKSYYNTLFFGKLSQNDERCYSACWSKEEHTCHCHLGAIWMPLPNETVDSVVVDWPCQSPRDCSYNGVCSETTTKRPTCKCNTGWGGVRCGELQFLPVNKRHMGIRRQRFTATGELMNVSTWGAPILWDEQSQRWHAWASEMIHDCGINAWASNSQIVHYVSSSNESSQHYPIGPFVRKNVFAPPFAHEPSVKRGPNGEWVMLYSAFNPTTRKTSHQGYLYNETLWKRSVCTNCSQGASLSPVSSRGCPFQRGQPKELAHPFVQIMATAPTPNGPWKHFEIHPLTQGWDWNTALTINADASAVALIRGGMVWYASNYADNTTWHPVNGENNKDNNKRQSPSWPIAVEDPYIWRDGNGIYHAIAHCFDPFFGVHAFVDPKDVPTDFSKDIMNWTVTGVAYGNKVNFTDGTSFTFGRRERPQLIWAPGKEGVTPVALSNGVLYGSNRYTLGQDMTFTLIQGIRQTVIEQEKSIQ